MASIKGPGEAQKYNGSALRIAIVHARWNMTIIEPLVAGAKSRLLDSGVQEQNIKIHSVPGSWELPIAVQSLLWSDVGIPALDAIIAIGVLIKGETMHFEYIAEAVAQGLMRAQLDTRTPLIFGLLTVLNEEQAKARAGITHGSHNHGHDWGLAAVEMAVKMQQWPQGAKGNA